MVPRLPKFEQCLVGHASIAKGYTACFHALQVLRAEIENIYMRMPHSLKGTVPADVIERLQKFYRQTFWCNIAAFNCCQAAQALAKRGLNVVRIFIGLSSGGVGQSLYSSHLQARCWAMINFWSSECPGL